MHAALVFLTTTVISCRMKKQIYVRPFILIPCSILLGLILPWVAKLLILSISFFTNVFYFHNFSFESSSPWTHTLSYFSVIPPVLGGLIVGLIARFGSSAIRGHGIPEAMENILLKESRIAKRIFILKPLSAAISIGSGGPFGAEGPIIATGGALGSILSHSVFFRSNERKVLLAAGAAAGMAAIFGTPLAAILLAIELLLFEFRALTFIPVALAAAISSAIRLKYIDASPFLKISSFAILDLKTYFAIVIGGIIFGLVAVCASKIVYFIEDAFEHLPMHWMWWPAIGGLAVGIVGFFEPRSLGVGYANIQSGIDANISIGIAVSILIWKFVSWSISLGSGTSGGTLAPLLTFGSLTGFLLGKFLIPLFPEISISLLALVGMAAVFAAASRGFLASVAFAFECTQKTECIAPLLVGCGVAYFVSHYLMKHSIMTERIARRGTAVPHEYFAHIYKTEE